MAENNNRVLIIVAIIGVFGTITAAVIGNWDKIVSRSHPPQIESPHPSAQTPAPSQPSIVNISGRWLDANSGLMTVVIQSGNTFTSTAQGPDCIGHPQVQFQGRGTIEGNSIKTHYRSNYSEGNCESTVSVDGNHLTGACVDSVCGQLASGSSVRQP